jgi:hypothetical protein
LFLCPFLAGSLCMAEPASVYFKWRCPELIPGFYYFYFFPPLTDDPTQAIAFLKIKNMTNLVKQCRGAS